MRASFVLVMAAALCGCGSTTVKKIIVKKSDAGSSVEAEAPRPISVVMGTVKGTAFEPKGGGAQDSGPQANGMYPFVRVELVDMSTGGCALDTMADRKLSFWVYNAKDGNAVVAGTYKGAGSGVDTNGTIFPHFNWKDPMGE